MPATSRLSYDIVTVGGGLGGASLARAMAERGARVLVLEREAKFKDRVRGEGMSPWGVAEAKELGIYDLLLSTGNELRWWDFYFGDQQAFHRDLVATTPHGNPLLTFFHPNMQEILLQAATEQGAEVRRKATVRSVMKGSPARVIFEEDGSTSEVSCRLAVGVDGRGSLVRRWAGFEVQKDPDFLVAAGILLDGTSAEEHTLRMAMNLASGTLSFLNPQGQGRVRAYLVSRKDADLRLQGAAETSRFIAESVLTGLPQDLFDGAQAAGPLATFDGAASFVKHPYHDHVALVGDAATTSDPSWGQGLSLTLRDVRVLRDRLLADDDWDRAGHAYAEEHDRYSRVSHTVDGWLSELFFAPGAEADAKRARALPLIAEDGSRIPDANFSGPDMELDETKRRRLFGEE